MKAKNCQLSQSFKLCFRQEKWWPLCFATWKEFCLLSFSNTVNAVSYSCLLKWLKTAIWNKQEGLLMQEVILLHDNIRPHTVWVTVDSLGIQVLPHPPYSPDLAPSDYHRFAPLKKMLRGQKFASDMEVQWAIRQRLAQQPTSLFALGIHKLVERWDKCLNKLGWYVEK